MTKLTNEVWILKGKKTLEECGEKNSAARECKGNNAGGERKLLPYMTFIIQ